MSKGYPPALPPPASEGEVPDAAPVAPPVQVSTAPKMVPGPKTVKGNRKTGLVMRKRIGK